MAQIAPILLSHPGCLHLTGIPIYGIRDLYILFPIIV
nr:MAG TPA: hypothetical protein [Caudoviricetes sp.]DAT95944.1 MAG TPA: hypothetical protein [Caudoviricetes sp.]DAV74196.1 MAG TPA: hypothetical protein [Caudoviricetes sp.]